ncbi:olfactory receptor 4C46-like [Tachyglossus aculeatus]|uniref:olfactory receptor 4C46-like n=1 Tax=Tachyglossus aculeatus TaxID=9261 RepID=UPI0018F71D3A|nr:olfactory receptor 4C46-like [Tachyglossus aculeatus]
MEILWMRDVQWCSPIHNDKKRMFGNQYLNTGLKCYKDQSSMLKLSINQELHRLVVEEYPQVLAVTARLEAGTNLTKIIILFTKSAALTCVLIAYLELVENENNVTEFILLRLTQDPRMQKSISVVFLIIYIVTVGNLIIVVFGEHFIGGAETILLTVMAYAHSVAICKPLHYTTIMSRHLCRSLVAVAWARGFLHATIQNIFMAHLPFFGPNVIDHFMCDLYPLLKLLCSDTHTLSVLGAATSGGMCVLIFVLLMIFYAFILHSLKTHSAVGRLKALSTCASDFIVVIFFFIPCIFEYVQHTTSSSIDKAVAVFYIMITPMLNPFIYTLRNAVMIKAIKMSLSKTVSFALE